MLFGFQFYDYTRVKMKFLFIPYDPKRGFKVPMFTVTWLQGYGLEPWENNDSDTEWGIRHFLG
jgi:hypothetical protein